MSTGSKLKMSLEDLSEEEQERLLDIAMQAAAEVKERNKPGVWEDIIDDVENPERWDVRTVRRTEKYYQRSSLPIELQPIGKQYPLREDVTTFDQYWDGERWVRLWPGSF